MAGTLWSATETRTIEAYSRSDNAQNETRFRVSDQSAFSEEPSYWLESDELTVPFHPAFRLAVNDELLEKEAHISPDDLTLSLIIRDRAIKRWEVVETIPLIDRPDIVDFSSEVLSRFAGPRRLEFVSLVAPSYSLPYVPGRAYKPQHVISQRSFEVNLRREGTRFPVRVVPPEWFTERNLPRDTVWTTDWKSQDFRLSPAEVLDVVINENHANALQGILGDSDARGIMGNQIACDIFAEVSYVVLSNAEEFIAEPSTMLGTVLSRLGIRTEPEFSSALGWFEHPSEALRWLRSQAQSFLDFAGAVDRARL
ncbi:MAG: hypothetical protein WD273_05465 [Trueperaceae bacterium]